MNPVRHTLGELALKLGAQTHHLYRLAKRGKVPFEKIGRLHIFADKDVPKIRQALQDAGYLRGEAVHVGSN